MEEKINNTKLKEDEQIGKIWFQGDKMLLKFPKGFADRSDLPIKLERSLAVICTKDCIEIRNLQPV